MEEEAGERKEEERERAAVRGSSESKPSITDSSKPYLLVTAGITGCATVWPNIVKGPEKAGT